MALFEETTPLVPSPEVSPVKVLAQPETYKGIAIDTAYVPKSSMLMWINGSNWRVTYFSQVLDESQEPTALAIQRAPAYQQYRKIVGMDLKVSGSLDISQDDRIRTFSVTGSGHAYPFLTPNKGDMFIGNIGDGKLGLFTITTARRETFLKDSTYAIEWKMVSNLTEAQSANLELKSILTYYYNAGSLLSGCGPFVTEQAAEDDSVNRKTLRDLINRYFSDFYSNDFGTFIVPDQLVTVYDHFVTKFMSKVIGVSDFPRLKQVKLLNVMSEPVMSRDTIWDAVIARDPTRMCYSTQRVQLVSTKISRWRPELQAIGYTGIPRFVFPMEVPYDVDSAYDGQNLFTYEGLPYHEGQPRRPLVKFQSQFERGLSWFLTNTDPAAQPWAKPPLLNPVAIDQFYVLSEHFYTESSTQSRLELLVRQHINREDLNMDALRSVISSSLDWDNLERFYYHPLLIALIKSTLR